MVSKDELRAEFSKNPKEYYDAPLFKEEGFQRFSCPLCGKHYWAAAERENCGDSSHEDYSFFRAKPRDETYAGLWKKFADYFRKNGHEVIPRYPVISRWRDDLNFTIASIVDFQRLEDGRIVFEYPANPLVVPQICLRFPDIANIGVTGRHLSGFMMAGQHAFGKEGYWREKCLELNYGFLTKVLGVKKEELTYGEDAWAMPDFSAFGPCIESFSKGSELVNSVFMQYYWDGSQKRELPLRVIDVGWGFERLLWYYRGDLTIYDATFPRQIAFMKKKAGLKDSPLLKKYAAISSRLDVESVRDFREEKKKIASKLGITLKELESEIAPVQGVWAIADHTRSLLFALADGGLPSNSAGGYNLRVLLRRALGFATEYDFDFDFASVFEMHAEDLKDVYPELREALPSVNEIFEVEKRKYAQSLEKARSTSEQILSKPGGLTAEKMATLYESHGVTPELLERVAHERGIEVAIPSDYYAKITSKHVMEEKKREEKPAFEGVKPTRRAYYDDDRKFEGDAVVAAVKGDLVALDATLFYPEGGGQCGDKGWLDDSPVVDVQASHGVVMHKVQGGSFKAGQKVRMRVDRLRRDAITRHHTATHVLNASCRRVLGNHVWQCGSRKDADEAHLDVTHYEKPSRDKVNAIEALVNGFIREAHPVRVFEMERGEAERKYSYRIYQGGGAIGKRIRVLDVEGIDVEACGGLHRHNTSEIGFFKITGVEQVQDGVTRFRYKAGPAALSFVQEEERLLDDAAQQLYSTKTALSSSIRKQFEEWKARGKEIEKLQEEAARLIVAQETVGLSGKAQRKVSKTVSATPELAQKIALDLAKAGADAVITTTDGFVAVATHEGSKSDAVKLLLETGAKGGGSKSFARGKK
ncbi:alanine--tRNA ligase [Candidatus Micrarchaeota archaeon CG1_02_60_51]|nr:MAG: alanine--tRNA ligase [Candidatus Micrarchaeota archaeon CG1_02_60_51]PIO02177.1 MAG: alanine--tRNA ligase [Candidatus Micrarchaeota archaeon CG09_land_8_20_14_0_10_60_16]PIY91629.1 MAG: alanine--tRNA ligase [Candidatus Micrarchaeota archaeon CG_4_10_14_0_8_um_filter_60_7]